MTTPHAANDTSTTRNEDLREQLCRIIDELRSERADGAALKAKFEALWKQIGADPTVH